MTTELSMLTYSVALMIVMIFAASLLRTKMWMPAGLKAAFGNRDESEMPDTNPVAERAKRAAANMMEGMLMFAPLVLTAHAAGISNDNTALGAQLFFYARVAYFPTYLAGIPYVRTGIWGVGLVGIIMILLELF